ncbi:zinc-binding dehydrogenase [Streptomyces sp. NPDC006638]|uniref:zinc-binding dehydrogenase n=1 Tax=Streptomyces sp. NPDC006638 TaxID=3157183 RepID=UPI0033BE4302
MKAVSIREFGRPEGLAVVEVPDPVPGAGQVVIATEAIGVGGVDTLIRRGVLAAYGFQEGHIPGGEVAGTVTAVGDGVDASWIGRRVWGFTGTGGGYAEQAVAPVAEILPLPADLSAADAVTLGSAGVVAHFALVRARFVPGETVLVRGAAGSLGIMAVQFAARGGAGAVAVTTSSAERGERLRRLGATHVLDRGGSDSSGAGTGPGSGDTPAGYDVIIDVVAGEHLPSFLDRLDPNGRMVVVGIVGGPPPADFGTRMTAAFQKSLSFSTLSTDTVPAADRTAARAAHFAAAARGEIEAVVHELLPLDQAALAHRKMDAGEVFGRIVLTP